MPAPTLFDDTQTIAEGSSRPHIITLLNGGFAVLYKIDTSPTTYDLAIRFYDAGSQVISETVIQSDIPTDNSAYSLGRFGAALSDGSVVVVWTDNYTVFGQGNLYATRFDSFGQQIGEDILVASNDPLTPQINFYQDYYVVATDDGFFIAWGLFDDVTEDTTIDGRFYDIDGAPLSGALDITPAEDGNWDALPVVAHLADGTFVIGNSFGELGEWTLEFFDATGAPTGDPAINMPTNRWSANLTDITALSSGGFAVVWWDRSIPGNPGGFQRDVWLQIYDADHVPIGDPILVDGPTSRGANSYPNIIELTDGDLFIVWETLDPLLGPAGFNQVWGQRYNSDGSLDGDRVLIGGSGSTNVDSTDVSLMADGRIVVSWSEFGVTQFQILDPREGPISLEGSAGYDTWYGTPFGDEFIGLGGQDFLWGGGGADFIDGGDADDALDGGGGADIVIGGAGEDTIYARAGEVVDGDSFDGGADYDSIYAIGNVSLRPATLIGFEQLIFDWNEENFNFVSINASQLGATLDIRGSDGGDELDIFLTSGQSVDLSGLFFVFWSSRPRQTTTPGYDDVVIIGAGGNETVVGSSESDTVFAGAGDDNVSGGAQSDYLYGEAGNDTLNGGDGDDVMRGGTGVDTYIGGAGLDRVSFADLGATQAVNANLLTQTISNDGYGNAETMTSIEDLGGGTAFVDTFIGDNNVNLILADRGDIVNANGGDDAFQLYGAPGTLNGGDGNDTINGFTSTMFRQDTNADGLAELITTTTGVIVNLNSGQIINDGFGNSGNLASIENVGGSDYNDLLTGNSGVNDLTGYEGDDTLQGLGGNDRLFGDEGNDILRGGAGADALNGGFGSDTASYAGSSAGVTVNLTTGVGTNDAAGDTFVSIENLAGTTFNDTLIGDAGANVLTGDDGVDALSGNGGNDTLYAGAGADGVNGGDGDDVIIYNFGDGIDTSINGGNGTDTITTLGNAGSESLDAFWNGSSFTFFKGSSAASIEQATADLGGGVDWLRLYNSTVAVSINLALGTATGFTSIVNIENAWGTAFADTLIGNGVANTIRGGAGNDQIEGGGGADTLIGEDGADTILGGDGADLIYGLAGVDTIDGGDGDDIIYSSFGEGIDVIDGGAGFDTIICNGNSGSETLDVAWDGSAFTIFKGAAVSSIEQATANMGVGGDWLRYTNSTASITIDLATNSATGFTTILSVENVAGGTADDTILGSNVANNMLGNGGADIINGAGGNDTINGGGGTDNITGGAGSDTLIGGADSDVFVFATGSGVDTILDFDANPTGGQDFIDLLGYGINAGNFGARVVITDQGANTLVTIDGTETILLAGVTGDGNNVLTQADFLIG